MWTGEEGALQGRCCPAGLPGVCQLLAVAEMSPKEKDRNSWWWHIPQDSAGRRRQSWGPEPKGDVLSYIPALGADSQP